MKFKFLLFLIFFPAAVFGQMLNKAGELTLLNGDTLTGDITYFYDKPSQIVFSSENLSKQVYPVSQVREIKLENGERFVSKKYDAQGDNTYVVLKVLIESSKISLYVREENAAEYFYVSKDDALYRLENNDVETRQDNNTFRQKDNKYIKTLSMLMPDRIDLFDKLYKIQLTEQELTTVLLNYNQGDVTYFWNNDFKGIKESNWVAFAQYSKFGSFQDDQTTAYSAGQMIGLQYYFDKNGRHSLKISLEHSKYTTEWEKLEVTGLGFRYEFEFKQAEKYGAYFLMHLGEIAQVNRIKKDLRDYSELTVLTRFSPGVGFEIKPLPRIATYAELNNLLFLKHGPKSFSVGLKYDFGATTR